MSAQSHENRIREKLGEEGDADLSLFEQCCTSTEAIVRDRPLLSTVTAFGVGLGVGAIVGGLLADSPRLSHRRTAESIGQRVLDAMTNVLPNSVRERLPA